MLLLRINNNKKILQIISAVMKLSNLASKFFLLVILAKVSNTETVATFGLYWTLLTTSAILIGLDVYSSTARKILKSASNIPFQVTSHFSYVVLASILSAPLMVFIFSKNVTSENVIVFIFFLHIIFEFANQEFSRILVPLKKPFYSSSINFIRGSIWVPFALVSYFYGDNYLIQTIISWLCGSILSFIFGLSFFIKSRYITNFKFNSDWIVNSIRSCFLFFLSTLCLRLILSLDRFLINGKYTTDLVAVYIFYSTIVFSIVGLVDSGISTWNYPNLVQAIKDKDKNLYYKAMSSYLKESFYFTASIIFVLCFSLPYLFHNFFELLYYDNIMGLYMMLFGVFCYSLTMPFHYVLYGNGRDNYILLINLIGLLSMVMVFNIDLFSDEFKNASMLMVSGLSAISILRVILFAKFHKGFMG
ncbi:hypothetical protein FCV73_08445 [Vibrio sp. F13]|uniref:hypothetical protein n=1 Tax=unclassified Vibrio TaxID=2614977 RepID=UPI0010BD79F7|nr:hypothetical protein [Vibrio sp. F13]TKF91877.1 hypothetical protein FCV73_08445 [Vibrio sp. F13]